jgi:hypothetical protein
MVRAEPLSWKDSEANRSGTGGLFATRVVMATSEVEASRMASAIVEGAVRGIAETDAQTPVLFGVEESAVVEGIVWRQPRGFSYFTDG